jgi:hypothetical protein
MTFVMTYNIYLYKLLHEQSSALPPQRSSSPRTTAYTTLSLLRTSGGCRIEALPQGLPRTTIQEIYSHLALLGIHTFFRTNLRQRKSIPADDQNQFFPALRGLQGLSHAE